MRQYSQKTAFRVTIIEKKGKKKIRVISDFNPKLAGIVCYYHNDFGARNRNIPVFEHDYILGAKLFLCVNFNNDSVNFSLRYGVNPPGKGTDVLKTIAGGGGYGILDQELFRNGVIDLAANYFIGRW